MNSYIALLRGINVSGQKKIKMADLRGALGRPPLFNLKTYIQSGNIVFRSDLSDVTTLEELFVERLGEAFGYDISVLVLTAEELAAIHKQNPFENESKAYGTFLFKEPPADRVETFDELDFSGEYFVRTGSVIYLFLPNGAGRAKLNNNFIESRLGVTATTRNWKTVSTLLEMTKQPD